MYPVQKKTSNASIALAVNDQVEEKVKLPDDQSRAVEAVGLMNGHANGKKTVVWQ